MARRRVSLHGLWQQAGIGESFLRRRARRDPGRPRATTNNKLHCSCSGRVQRQKRVPQHFCRHSTLFLPFLQPACQAPRTEGLFQYSLRLLLLPLSDFKVPLSGLGHCERVFWIPPWRHGSVVRPIIIRLCSFVGAGIFLTFKSHLHLTSQAAEKEAAEAVRFARLSL